jgi:16S rRNA (uracil1498-N3)-methyltransferase
VNLLLLEPGELDARGRALVSGRRAAHLIQVLGAKPGARVRVGVERGALAHAEIVAVDADRVQLRVESAVTAVLAQLALLRRTGRSDPGS